jgi:hypothetical protein
LIEKWFKITSIKIFTDRNLPRIEHSIEIDASRERVWEVISDLDNEPEYWWGTKEVKNISREGNVINRDIIQNFRNHRISQKVILRPKDEVETQYLKGLTEGKKLVRVETLGEGRQKVIAEWDVHFPGIYVLMTYFISRHVRKGTVEALERIKKASEANGSTTGRMKF